MNRVRAALLAVLALVAGSASAAALPTLGLDPERTTVSGLSSGAYMAQQLHLAYSGRIAGAALVAGGPWHCAEGSLQAALGRCMMPAEGRGPEVAALAAAARAAAKAGRIAPLTGLAGDTVLVLHGAGDTTVSPVLGKAAAELYQMLGQGLEPPMQVRTDLGRAFGHTFPTLGEGSRCGKAETPWVGACGFDAAGAILSALHGGNGVKAPAAATGSLQAFDQDVFRPGGQDPLLASEGWIYVPAACASGARCGLHIAFHGCQQNVTSVGQAFVRDAGYNRWADAYGVVVLYPQARASMAPLNPKACWDWWGYSGEHYDSRDGLQLRAVVDMARALGVELAPSLRRVDAD